MVVLGDTPLAGLSSQLIFWVVVFGILGAFVNLPSRPRRKQSTRGRRHAPIPRDSEQSAEYAWPSQITYQLRDDFLSVAELSFYRVLEKVVGERAVVCPKVRLGDLFFATSDDNSQRTTGTNQINQKHVDFILCNPKTMQPVLGIELDDKSHQRPKQIKSDEIKNYVFATAQVPLLRVRASRAYVTADLERLLAPHLTAVLAQPRSTPPQTGDSGLPTCPKCGVAMVERTAKRGKNIGKSFWGCVNYPKCREVVE